MTQSLYVPVSQYLANSSPTSSNKSDLFTFHINGEIFFSVFKSLACFLSPKAKIELEKGSSDLYVNIPMTNFDSFFVAKSLVKLLKGKPIKVNPSNFWLYETIFTSLGNLDFDSFFEDDPPDEEIPFYLSIQSLSYCWGKNLEDECVMFYFLPDTEIPVSLSVLFWDDISKIQNKNLRSLSKETIYAGAEYLYYLLHGVVQEATEEVLIFLHAIQVRSKLISNLPHVYKKMKNDKQIKSNQKDSQKAKRNQIISHRKDNQKLRSADGDGQSSPEVKKLENENHALTHVVNSLHKTNIQLLSDRFKIQKENSQLQNKIKPLQVEVEKKDSHINSLKTEISQLKDQINHLQASINERTYSAPKKLHSSDSERYNSESDPLALQ